MELPQAIYETRQLLTSLQYQQWRIILFSASWWILVATLVTSWVVWFRLVERRRLFEIMTYALLVVIIGTTLDMYGYKLGFWSYPIKVFYLNPGLIAGDWALPPVMKSLVYQQFPDWKRFLLAQVGIAAFLSFVGEPALVLIGAYKMYEWSYWQSFLVYIPVAIVVKLLVDWLRKLAVDR